MNLTSPLSRQTLPGLNPMGVYLVNPLVRWWGVFGMGLRDSINPAAEWRTQCQDSYSKAFECGSKFIRKENNKNGK